MLVFRPNPAKGIVYAGVGKKDWEIRLGLEKNILCFNVESIAELEVINEIAARMDKVADVCLRINPDVRAHTHKNRSPGHEKCELHRSAFPHWQSDP